MIPGKIYKIITGKKKFRKTFLTTGNTSYLTKHLFSKINIKITIYFLYQFGG